MTVARFLPLAWIEVNDAEMIIQVLRTLHRRANRRWPPSVGALVRIALARVEAVVLPAGDCHAGFVGVLKEELLDLAGELLDAAGMLHCGGHHVDAMAIEGVEARLLEALVGAGPVEMAG